MVQIWLFATPSVYMRLDKARRAPTEVLLSANPMTWLIATFRARLGPDQPIHWGQFGLASLFSVVMFVAGCFYFRRVEKSFADII